MPMSLPRVITARRERSEAGFTLVEVIIAMAVMVLVSGAAVAIVSSSNRASGRIKVGDRQKAIAGAVLARAMSNREWIEAYSCGVGPCAAARKQFVPPNDPMLREAETTVSHTVSFDAVGVDLPIDGVGGADADRQTPDVYRIAVTVSTTDAASGPVRPYVATGTLDMAVRAKTGALRLRVCAAQAGIDERVGLGLCADGTAHDYPIAPPVSNCGVVVSDECRAWNASSSITDSRTLRIKPKAMSFQLKGPIGHPSPPVQTVTTSTSGSAEVTGLDPGRYELTLTTSPDRWRLWSSHSVPSGGLITIKEGEVNDAVQVFYPAAERTQITLQRLNDSDPAAPVIEPGAWTGRAVKLMPVPRGRAALASGTPASGTDYRGWTRYVRGQRSVVIEDLSPGLYQLTMLEYPGRYLLDHQNRALDQMRTVSGGAASYIWVPPVDALGANRSPKELIIRDYFCDESVRAWWMNKRITPKQREYGMLEHGFKWYGTNPAVVHEHCVMENADANATEVVPGAGA